MYYYCERKSRLNRKYDSRNTIGVSRTIYIDLKDYISCSKAVPIIIVFISWVLFTGM